MLIFFVGCSAGSAGAEDSLLDGGVLIETRAEQDAPAVVLPFDLGELAGVADDLTAGQGRGRWG